MEITSINSASIRFSGLFTRPDIQSKYSCFAHTLKDTFSTTKITCTRDYYPFIDDTNEIIKEEVEKFQKNNAYRNRFIECTIKNVVHIMEVLPVKKEEAMNFMKKYYMSEDDFINFIKSKK